MSDVVPKTLENIRVGGRYKANNGSVVSIKTTINKHHPDFKDGFRFVDNESRTYTPEGKWTTDVRPTSHDLKEEI